MNASNTWEINHFPSLCIKNNSCFAAPPPPRPPFLYVEPKFLPLCLVCGPELGINGSVILNEDFPLLSSVAFSPLFTFLEFRLFIPLLHLFIHLFKKYTTELPAGQALCWALGPGAEGAVPPPRSAVRREGLCCQVPHSVCVVPPPPHPMCGELLEDRACLSRMQL